MTGPESAEELRELAIEDSTAAAAKLPKIIAHVRAADATTATETLRTREPATEALQIVATAEPARALVAAADALAVLDDEHSRDVSRTEDVSALTDAWIATRRQLVQALSTMAEHEVEWLVEYDGGTRLIADMATGDVGRRAALSVFQQAAGEHPTAIVSHADVIRMGIKAPDDSVRQTSLAVLQNLSKTDQYVPVAVAELPQLLSLLSDDRAATRWRAAAVIRNACQSRAVGSSLANRLVHHLDDPDSDVKSVLLLALRQLAAHEPESVSANADAVVRSINESYDPDVIGPGLAVIEAIVESAPETLDAVDDFEKYIRHSDSDLVITALRVMIAAATLDSEVIDDAIEATVGKLGDDEDKVVKTAALTVHNVGKAHPEYVKEYKDQLAEYLDILSGPAKRHIGVLLGDLMQNETGLGDLFHHDGVREFFGNSGIKELAQPTAEDLPETDTVFERIRNGNERDNELYRVLPLLARGRPEEVGAQFDQLVAFRATKDIEVQSAAIHAMAALAEQRSEYIETTIAELREYITTEKQQICDNEFATETFGQSVLMISSYPDQASEYVWSHTAEIRDVLRTDGSRNLAAAILGLTEEHPTVLEPFLDVMISYLEEENSHLKGVMFEAVEDLASASPHTVEPYLGTILTQGLTARDDRDRGRALVTARQVGTAPDCTLRGHGDAIAEYLTDSNPKVRATALSVFSESIPDDIDTLLSVIEKLGARLKDADPEVREVAVSLFIFTSLERPSEIAPFSSQFTDLLEETDDVDIFDKALSALFITGLSVPGPVVEETDPETLLAIFTAAVTEETSDREYPTSEDADDVTLALLALHRDHADDPLPESVRDGVADAGRSLPENPEDVVPEDIRAELPTPRSAPDVAGDLEPDAADPDSAPDDSSDESDTADSAGTEEDRDDDASSADSDRTSQSDEYQITVGLGKTSLSLDHPAVRIAEWDDEGKPIPTFESDVLVEEIESGVAERQRKAAGVYTRTAVLSDDGLNAEDAATAVTLLAQESLDTEAELFLLTALVTAPQDILASNADRLLSYLEHDDARLRSVVYDIASNIATEGTELVEPYAAELGASVAMEAEPMDHVRTLYLVAVLQPTLFTEYDYVTGAVPTDVAPRLFAALDAGAKDDPEIAVAVHESVAKTLDTTTQLPDETIRNGLRLLGRASDASDEVAVSQDILHRYLTADSRAVQYTAAITVTGTAGEDFSGEQLLLALLQLLTVEKSDLSEDIEELPEIAAAGIEQVITADKPGQPADGATAALRYHGKLATALPDVEEAAQIPLLRTLAALARIHPPTLAQHIETLANELDSAPPVVTHYLLVFMSVIAGHRPIAAEHIDQVAGYLPAGTESDEDTIFIALGILGITAKNQDAAVVAEHTDVVVDTLATCDDEKRVRRASRVVSDIASDQPGAVDSHAPDIIETLDPTLDDEIVGYLLGTLNSVADSEKDTHETLADTIGNLVMNVDSFSAEQQSELLNIVQQLADHPDRVVEQLDHIEPLLAYDETEIRQSAVEVVWRLSQESSAVLSDRLGPVAPLLSDPDEAVQLRAVYTFVEVTVDHPVSAAHVEKLADCLRRDDTNIRQWAATAFENLAMHHPDAIAPHITALTNCFEGPAKTAEHATSAVKLVAQSDQQVTLSRDAVGHLMSHHDNADVLYERTALLATLATNDPTLLSGHRDVLRTRIRHTNRDISQQALEALRHVGSAPRISG